MIIPVRCFTCGNVLADKELAYRKLVQDGKQLDDDEKAHTLTYIRFVEDILDKDEEDMKSVEGKVLDILGVTKMCCRRHMLTSVDVLEYI
jgi:DNA-directed RNA polymerase I, II, and III subunit RPABC5